MNVLSLPVLPRTLPLAAGAALLTLAIAGCNSDAAPNAAPPPPAVSVAQVLNKKVAQWDEFTGRIAAVETVDLRPRVSGYIERVNYAEGQEVAKGDVLFVIDQRSYRAELARAEADLARARSQAELGRSEAARAGKLAAARAISTEEFDQRKAAAAQAAANVRAAQAALDIARLNMEYTQVRAPIAGRASRAQVTAGNLAQADQTLLTTIVSQDEVYVYFESDEQSFLRYNALARSGERPDSSQARVPVRVGLASDEDFPYEGVVDFVDNRVDPQTGTIRSRAVLDNRRRIFTPGLFARVRVLGAGARSALLIDPKAVLTDQDRKYVYVLGEGNTAQRRDIVLGRQAEGLQVVASGLKKDDQVIVHGVQKIFFPGMPVQPQPIDMGAPSLAVAAAGAP